MASILVYLYACIHERLRKRRVPTQCAHQKPFGCECEHRTVQMDTHMFLNMIFLFFNILCCRLDKHVSHVASTVVVFDVTRVHIKPWTPKQCERNTAVKGRPSYASDVSTNRACSGKVPRFNLKWHRRATGPWGLSSDIQWRCVFYNLHLLPYSLLVFLRHSQTYIMCALSPHRFVNRTARGRTRTNKKHSLSSKSSLRGASDNWERCRV